MATFVLLQECSTAAGSLAPRQVLRAVIYDPILLARKTDGHPCGGLASNHPANTFRQVYAPLPRVIVANSGKSGPGAWVPNYWSSRAPGWKTHAPPGCVIWLTGGELPVPATPWDNIVCKYCIDS